MGPRGEARRLDLEPMLARAGDRGAVAEGFGYEFKWDGVRVLVDVTGGEVTPWSRRGRDLTVTYPELQDLTHVGDAVVDGEVVALEDGRPSFARIQQRMNLSDPARVRAVARRVPVALLAFDLLRADGRSLLGQPWERRREALAGLVTTGPTIQVPPAHDDLDAALAIAADLGLEGVVAKRRGSTYQPGRRSPDWRKLRLVRRQELVVGGWRPGRDGWAGRIGSLLVGYHDPAGRLVYAGAVGSGLTGRLQARLEEELTRRPDPPFAGAVPHDDAVFVEPTHVVEVRFREWTPDGVLRQPSLLGLRDDKDPAAVVREEPGEEGS